MRTIFRVIETSWFKGLLITHAYDSYFKKLYNILLTLTVIRNHTMMVPYMENCIDTNGKLKCFKKIVVVGM